jgi:hypothetical protein
MNVPNEGKSDRYQGYCEREGNLFNAFVLNDMIVKI